MQGRTYRYFEGEPLYPFGHGLSYTRFEYSHLDIDRTRAGAADTVHATVSVKNIGSRAGDEVVQLYVHALDPKRARARQELRGFERITLAPGETRRVSFDVIPLRDLAYYDIERKDYAVDNGRYEIQLGASSRDIRLRTSFAVTGDAGSAAASATGGGRAAFDNHCRTCHSLQAGDNRLGPSLHGIVGAKAGAQPGYASYSQSLVTAGMTWDETSLDRFITDPERVIPNNNMKPFKGITDESIRRAIVAFLKSGGNTTK
jgi:cytochrome c2